ncbi:MAG: glycoside hydrolase family 78 protein [Candidatus Cryptobacteroides sp.]
MKKLRRLLFITLAAIISSTFLSACAETVETPEFTGQWIGCHSPEDNLQGRTVLPARYLRKEVELVSDIRKATLHICGLGLYETWINGEMVSSDQVLSPTVSDYHKTVYYNSFDVTPFLNKGVNSLAVALGNGRYVSMRMDVIDGIPVCTHYDVPKLLYQLDIQYKNGERQSVVSDGEWKVTADGPVRGNNEFDGEIYDARMELDGWTVAGYDDTSWAYAEILAAPEGELLPQPNPNIAIQDVLKPVGITRVDDSYVIDMGQNMVGWMRFKAKGLLSGDQVTLRFAELTREDGHVYVTNLRTALSTDTYIASGKTDVDWQPMFVYHGFRFVEVTGLREEPSLADFEGHVFYDKMDVTGSFETSDEIINQVYRNAYWGIRGNYRGMPTDCPQRDERQGWMGDRTTGCYGESFVFNNHDLYAKWLKDISDSQTELGSLPSVAPRFWQCNGDNVTWPGVFVTAADMLYERFGDTKPICDHYQAMKKWMTRLKDRFWDGGVITRDIYGDWCMPPESPNLIHSQDPARKTDGPVLSTAFYYHLLGLMAKFAPIAGEDADAAIFLSQADSVKTAFNDRFFNAQEGYYANNTVTANVLPLSFGMVPQGREQDVFGHIVSKTVNDFDSHVSTGVVGIQVLMRTLTEYGRGDLAFKIASEDTYPSWGYMVRNGATTIWELWNGNTADPAMNSGNHVMLLGDLIIWEYEYLAGIRPLKPGYKEIEFKPYPVEGLDFVNCSYDSVSGKIVSNWKIEGGQFTYDIEVPKGCRARVLLPKSDGSRLEKQVRSGKHHFELALN